MSVQVLVAAMNQTDHSLLDRLNIQSDVIVGNQCDRNYIESFEWNGYKAQYLNFSERGVGLNRNNALMRADGDICLFADDDMRYVDGYAYLIEKAFQELPGADVIIFNINGRSKIKKRARVNRFNYLRYGTARIAIKLSSIKKNGIYFNQCFGGGTEHCHGEDNLFLTACLDKKLRIYSVPITIATLQNVRESTWDNGDVDRYLRDQGILYRTISCHFWKLLCLQDAIRRRTKYKKHWNESYRVMKNAVQEDFKRKQQVEKYK